MHIYMPWRYKVKLCLFLLGLFVLIQILLVHILHIPLFSRASNQSKIENKKWMVIPQTTTETKSQDCPSWTRVEEDLTQLKQQTGSQWQWQWIMKRIESLWANWVRAASHFLSHTNGTVCVKQVLIVPGLLTATDYANPDHIKRGAPLGDLVQWADLIAALHVLGHNLTLDFDFYAVARSLRYQLYSRDFDIIYADIITMKVFPSDVMKHYSCRFHVLDAYGTEAMYNDPQYSLQHKLKSMYGHLGLNLKQFYTFYPHSPDNSFLGFVVPPAPYKKIPKKKNWALLYGKNPDYFKAKQVYIEFLLTFIEVHATTHQTRALPQKVMNHGIVSGEEYLHLMAQSKVLIGLGLPLESTGPMEALAYGCAFINPKYKLSEQNKLPKDGKPTSRKLTSQVPYLEHYTQPPYVYTVDIENVTELKNVITQILKTPIQPITPFEFTLAGFVERLQTLIHYQDFCKPDRQWPPISCLQVVLGESTSCSEACMTKGLVCEPTYFETINQEQYFSQAGIQCHGAQHEVDIFYPSMILKTKQCIFQSNSNLFSCAGSMSGLVRLCPCRNYKQEQIALCGTCNDS